MSVSSMHLHHLLVLHHGLLMHRHWVVRVVHRHRVVHHLLLPVAHLLMVHHGVLLLHVGWGWRSHMWPRRHHLRWNTHWSYHWSRCDHVGEVSRWRHSRV